MPCQEQRTIERGDIPSTVSEQRYPLLRNKLFIPPVRPELVHRPRLNQQLQSGLSKALTLISAPAGYGKTTLVSGWLHAAGVPFAWVSLDEGDDDPIRFLHYLITAIQAILPPGQADLPGLLQHPHPDGFAPLLNLLIDEITASAPQFLLALDDFHVMQTPQVLGIVAYLLERIPVQMHLTLLTRADPPLPLARLRGRGQLVEIRAEDLSFTQEEAADFLQRVMGLRLSPEDIAALEERTEGWIAGLQLAALAVQERGDMHAAVASFTGSHFYIIDYLTEEALNRQPEPRRTFLLRTSILSGLCGSLCDAIVSDGFDGDRPSGDGTGQSVLEELERLNLFLIPLDNQRCWYRYHHLFADVLQLRLERQFPTLVPELHRRASAWYEQNGDASEAIRHALKAGDKTRAANLIEQNGCGLILTGESYTLLRWIEAAGADVRSRPWLATLKAWALAITGDFELVESILQFVEQQIADAPLTEELRIVHGSIATIRAFLANAGANAAAGGQAAADPKRAAAWARQALEVLPGGNEFSCSLRSVATSLYGDASWMSGSLEEAAQAYLEASRIGREAGNRYTTLIAQTNLAEVLAAQGKLHRAAALLTEIIQTAERPNGQKLPLADRALFELGKIHYEWNELDTAEDCLRQCMALCNQWGNPYLLAESTLMFGRLERGRGRAEILYDALRAAENLANDPHLLARQYRRLMAEIALGWLALGDVTHAEYCLGQTGLAQVRLPIEARPSGGIYDLLGLAQGARLRLLLTQRQCDDALELSAELLEQAQSEKRLGNVIEILILRALAFYEKKDMPQALAHIEQALSLAQFECYVRVFLEEGAPLAKLIFQASSHGLDGGYAARLLPAFNPPTDAPTRPAQALIEPLTEREIDVLELIENGCANQDIAAKLFISIPTVKRHISNIYAKLGAKSRTQALALARELGFFK